MAITCSTRANWLWAVAYLLAMTCVVLTMHNLRQRTLETLSTPQAKAQWDVRRATSPNPQASQRTESRRASLSAEPPALVLMRDHYAVMLASSLLFGTALFLILLLAIKGALWRAPSGGDGRQRADTPLPPT